MARHSSSRNPVGLFFIILGSILFLVAAGEFLLRLFFAVLALWLVFYGARLWSGKKMWHQALFGLVRRRFEE